MSNFERVNVQVKALKDIGPDKVMSGKYKQDVIIANKSGAMKLTVWENEVGLLEEGKCYQLNQMMVKTYQGLKLAAVCKVVRIHK